MDYEAMWYELKDQLERDCKFGAEHKSRRALLLMEEYEKKCAAQPADVHLDTAQQAQDAKRAAEIEKSVDDQFTKGLHELFSIHAPERCIATAIVDLEHIRDNCSIANMPNEVRYLQGVIDRLNNCNNANVISQ